ncbi:unnamed protein product [Tenebrio molitor]|nr:unnamed protein product [Tenebrio molitor]
MCLKLKCRFSQKYFCKNEVIIQNQNLFKMEAELFRSNIRWQLTENNTWVFFFFGNVFKVKNIFYVDLVFKVFADHLYLRLSTKFTIGVKKIRKISWFIPAAASCYQIT